MRVTVGAIGQSVRRGGMRFVAFVQNRISSCCSCRFEMCFLSPHVQEQVLVFVLVSFGDFGAGIVARAGEALFRCSLLKEAIGASGGRKSGRIAASLACLGWHIQR